MRLNTLILLATAGLAVAACETASTDDAKLSGDGAAKDAVVNALEENFQSTAGDKIFFDFNKSNIRHDAMETLKKQAEWMKKHGTLEGIIEGHCDVRGTAEYNMALGERRAHAAQKALIGLGIDAKRLDATSMGKEHPAVAGMTEEAHAQNRRAVTVVAPKH